MTKDKITLMLKALNSKPTGYRAGWVIGPCPLAPWRHTNGVDAHPSFAVKENGKSKSICKCLSCGFGGDLMDLLFRVSGMQQKNHASGYNMPMASVLITNETDDYDLSFDGIPEYGEEKEKVEFPFPESWLASFKSVLGFSEPVAYLKSRGVTKAIVDALSIKYDPLQKRIGFPFRNFKGELMGIQGRSIEANPALRYYQYGYQKHRNLHAWMGEDTVDFDMPVVLVEGPFDYTSVYRVYRNVMASFTSGLSVAKIKRIGDAAEIITLYDYGAGGTAARESVKKVLSGLPVAHAIPTKTQDDAGNMSIEEITKALSPLIKLPKYQINQ